MSEALWQAVAGLGRHLAREQMLCAALTPSHGYGCVRKAAGISGARAVGDLLHSKYPKSLFKAAREWDL